MTFRQLKIGETARCAKMMPTRCGDAVTTGSVSVCGAPIQCGGEKKIWQIIHSEFMHAGLPIFPALLSCLGNSTRCCGGIAGPFAW